MPETTLAGLSVAGLVGFGGAGRPRRARMFLDPVAFERLVENGQEGVQVALSTTALNSTKVHSSQFAVPE